MSEQLQGLASLVVAIGAMWMVLIGFAVVLNRPDWARAIARWPFTTALRLVRWAAGELLLALGRAIRGGRNHPEDRRRR